LSPQHGNPPGISQNDWRRQKPALANLDIRQMACREVFSLEF
jgi:hypothetical protein